MIDANDLFNDKETTIGHIETSSGGILMTDGGWEEDLPRTTQQTVALDVGLVPSRIPVFAVRRNNKRFLILSLDEIGRAHV